MKTSCVISSLLVALAMGGTAKDAPRAFFHIVGTNHTEITAVDDDGRLSWSNALPGAYTVERTADLLDTNWIRVASGVATQALHSQKVFDQNPPDEMVYVAAGAFDMGYANFSQSAYDEWWEEIPVHTVFVDAMYIDLFEVSQAKWQEVYDWANWGGTYAFEGNFWTVEHTNHPRNKVSWYNCVKWCNARSEIEGREPAYYTSAAKTNVYRRGEIDIQNDWVKWNTGYRLPTEAEWEKTARAGVFGKRFPWGMTVSHSNANYYASGYVYYDLSPEGTHPTYGTAYPFTCPVDTFAPNTYGLYNTIGNVTEWCWDWRNANYYTTTATNNPRGSSSGTERINRGGAWNAAAPHQRTASRIDRREPSYYDGPIGFRTVLPAGE